MEIMNEKVIDKKILKKRIEESLNKLAVCPSCGPPDSPQNEQWISDLVYVRTTLKNALIILQDTGP